MRNIQATVSAILAGDSLLGVNLLEISYEGGTKYWTDCPFDIAWTSPTAGAQTYEAQGNFMGISETQETGDVQITNISIIISALDIPTAQSIATNNLINKTVVIYKAFLDPTEEFSIIGEESAGAGPIMIFKGKISGYRITDTDSDARLQIEVASQFVNFNQTNGRSTTEESLQKHAPGDRFFQFAHITNEEIRWGKV